MALTQEQVTLISVAAFGVAPGEVHSNYFLDSDAAGKFLVGETGNKQQIHEVLGLKEPLTGTAAVAAVLEHEYNYLVSTNGLEKVSNPEFVKNVAKNLGAEDSKTLTVDLASGMSRYEALAKFALAEAEKAGGIENVAGIITAQKSDKTIDNAAKALVDSAVKPDTPNKPTDPVNTIELKDGRDNKTGTADNDLFDATAGQNQNGTIANAFATGDKLDGAGGYNTLKATVVQDFNADSGDSIDIRANTKNIQEVHFEAVGGSPVTVQATRMENVEQYWSNFSDEDLTVSDISLQGANLNVTKDVTFGLKDVRADAGLEAYFDSESLETAGPSASNSQLVIRIADVSTETPATPLANVNMNLSFMLGGTKHEITDLRSTDGSYAGLAAAVNDKLASLGLGHVQATLTDAYNSVTFADNTVNLPFTANVVMLTDPEGAEFGEVNFTQNAIAPVKDGFLVAGNAEPFDPNIATTLIESNLVLDNAGRGSLAGDVVIGGMSNSGKVVDKLNLSVDRSSKIGDLHTGFNAVSDTITPRAFKEIEVTSTGAKGNLEIGDIKDAKIFNASNFEGASLKVAGTATSNDAYSYITGSGKDTVNVNVNAENSASSKFSLSINTGAGDDVIHFQVTNGLTAGQVNLAGNGGWLTNQQLLNNVKIDAGDGNDQIVLSGAGNVIVNAGTGNDEVHADNIGGKAVFVFNNQTTDINQLLTNQDIVSNSDAPNSTGANGVAQTYNLFKATVQVKFLGFESKAIVIDSTNFETNTKQINQAIKKAIADSPQLSKLLAAHDNEGNALGIESLVDGELNLNDLTISITAPAAYDANETEGAKALRVANGQEMLSKDDLLNAAKAVNPAATVADEKYSNLTDSVNYLNNNVYVSEFATVGGVTVKGNDSTAESDNTINLGQGTDILMMGTGANSNDTLVLTGYDNGTNTIVHYSSLAGAGQDYLNLNAYVAGHSKVVLDTIANATGTLANNTVSKVAVNLSKDAFANFTNADLVKYLNYETPASGDPANIDAGLKAALSGLAATVDLNLKASTNYVLMLENSNNPGEYKAFHVTAATGDNKGKFAGAETIATLDFGVPTTGAGAVVPPPVEANVIAVNVTPAADGSYKGTFDGKAEADVFTVNATEADLVNLTAEISITNFGANDSLSFKGAYAAGMDNGLLGLLGVGQPVDISMDGANLQVILMDAPTTLDDIDTWIVTFEDVDANIAAVVNGAADTQAALAGLNDAWNADWLVLA